MQIVESDKPGTDEFELHDNNTIIKCKTLISQPYSDCVFSAGSVSGAEPDSIFFRLDRAEQHPSYYNLLLRPDEAQAMIWCLAGAVWSNLIGEEES